MPSYPVKFQLIQFGKNERLAKTPVNNTSPIRDWVSFVRNRKINRRERIPNRTYVVNSYFFAQELKKEYPRGKKENERRVKIRFI